MIQRSDKEHDLTNFDWFNDFRDTFYWLLRTGRVDEAARLKQGYDAYRAERQKGWKTNGDSEEFLKALGRVCRMGGACTFAIPHGYVMIGMVSNDELAEEKEGYLRLYEFAWSAGPANGIARIEGFSRHEANQRMLDWLVSFIAEGGEFRPTGRVYLPRGNGDQ
jgi:hypothetical protein